MALPSLPVPIMPSPVCPPPCLMLGRRGTLALPLFQLGEPGQVTGVVEHLWINAHRTALPTRELCCPAPTTQPSPASPQVLPHLQLALLSAKTKR